MTILHDHHIHTVYSNHGEMDMVVGAIIDRVNKVGLRRIVILEHVPEIPKYCSRVLSDSLGEPKRHQLDAIRRDISQWKDQSVARIFTGAEIDADPHRRDGRLLLHDLSNIDVVLASTHYLPGVPAVWYEAPEFQSPQSDRIYEEWMVWMMHIAANPAVDVLAHPGLEMVKVGAIKRFEGIILDHFEKLFQICVKHNTAFDLNENMSKRLTAEQQASYINVLALARDTGVKISCGSDAHELSRIGQFTWANQVAKSLGLKPDHYFRPQKKFAE